MKKLIIIALALTMGLLSFGEVKAQEGDLEISGHVNTVQAWQRTNGGVSLAPAGAAGLMTDGLRVPGGAGVDQFNFFVDEVELDIAKAFGENIRLRADVDFTQVARPSGLGTATNVGLEQAYITTNVPIGNGGELLFGRFNSRIGLDPIDRNELSGISFNTAHRTLLPHNMTGVKMWYGFNENWSIDIYVVNDLQDAAVATTTELPSYGFNIDYVSGEAGEGSWARLSGAAGPEQAGAGRPKRQYSFLGDFAAAINMAEGFWVDLEGLYRQDDGGALGLENMQYVAGVLALRYAFSDIWDGTLRYGFTWDLDSGQGANPAGGITAANPLSAITGLGFAGQQHDITVATGYSITDGARFVFEGRYDLGNASATGRYHVYGAGAGFYYDF